MLDRVRSGDQNGIENGLVAAVLGFGGIATAAVDIAKVISFIVLVFVLIAAVFGAIGSRRPVL